MVYIIGVGGPSCSGKSTFAKKLASGIEAVNGFRAMVLTLDNCYKERPGLDAQQRRDLCFNPADNYDHPNGIDWNLVQQYFQALRDGRTFNIPVYNFATHIYDRGTPDIAVPDGLDAVIVDGILALYDGPQAQQLSLIDRKIYIDTLITTCVHRRIERDPEERGRDLEDVLAQLGLTVVPMFKKFIAPTKANADVVYALEKESDTTKTVRTEFLLLRKMLKSSS